MADHINISAPRRRHELQERITAQQMKAEMEILRNAYDDMASDLDSIFTRIARGEQVELHYPDGTIVPITKARRRGGADTGDGADGENAA